jgi:multidrug efflux system membrane fusion protein
MDGDLNHPVSSHADTIARTPAREPARTGRRPPHTVRWLVIVGLLLALVLGGLYGFNRFRERAIANFFAHNKPPPAEISAVVATTGQVPHYAEGIGSLAAVHQVTVTSQVGGLVKAIMFKPGTEVKSGDPLVQLDDGPERGDLANYQAQARYAAVSLERARLLAQRQAGTQATVDQAQSQLDQARAQIAKTQALIAQKLIRAPFDGKLGVRQIDLGQYVSPGTPIVSLTNLKELFVNFTLPSTMRAEVVPGQEVKVTSDAFPGRTFTAKITTIDPQIRPDTRTMTIQARMDNPKEELLPGMYIDANVVLPPKPDRVILPSTAVDYTLYGDSVYVVRRDGTDAHGKPVLKAYRVAVNTGERWGNKVAILSGVKPGDRVVAAGQIKLQNGGEVIVSDNPPPQPPADPTLH